MNMAAAIPTLTKVATVTINVINATHIVYLCIASVCRCW